MAGQDMAGEDMAGEDMAGHVPTRTFLFLKMIVARHIGRMYGVYADGRGLRRPQ